MDLYWLIGPALTISNCGCGLSPQMEKLKHHENEPTKKSCKLLLSNSVSFIKKKVGQF